MRILVAEDDFTSRSILVAILKKWGYDPVVTNDGVAAWEALRRPDAPELVLLDWDMPGMNGLEVCRRLREIDSSHPALRHSPDRARGKRRYRPRAGGGSQRLHLQAF